MQDAGAAKNRLLPNPNGRANHRESHTKDTKFTKGLPLCCFATFV